MSAHQPKLSEKDQAEIVKLREDVKSLKLQRAVAVLGILGAVIAFTITNFDKLSDILYRNPRVQVVTEDEYLKGRGQIVITRRGEKESIVVSDSFPTSLKSYGVAPGAYHLTVRASGENVYERDFTVEKGEVRAVSVPSLAATNIRVSVDNQSGQIGPGSQLSFHVNASGNGYVWVFESRRDGLQLLYPENCPADCGNGISVITGLQLPDAQRRTLYAGTNAEEETLLFIVTSSDDSDSAKRIARQFDNAAITKASGGISKNNWGYEKVSYKILGK